MLKGWIQRATAATVAQWIAAISLVVAPALGQDSPSLKLLREFETNTVFFEGLKLERSSLLCMIRQTQLNCYPGSIIKTDI
jgi:hypothetical protein